MNLPHGRSALLWLLRCLLGLPAPSTDILHDIWLEDRLDRWVPQNVFEVFVYALRWQLVVFEPAKLFLIMLTVTMISQLRAFVLHPPSTFGTKLFVPVLAFDRKVSLSGSVLRTFHNWDRLSTGIG